MNWTLARHILFLATALTSAGVLCGRRMSLKRSKENASNPGSAVLETCLAMSFLIATSLLSSEALASDPLELGIKAYHDSKYQDAITHFRVAADAGDGRAQEVLGFMYLHGPNFYGTAVPLDRNQAIYWFGRASKAGREVAQHMLCVLSGRPANTVVDRVTCSAGTRSASSGPR